MADYPQHLIRSRTLFDGTQVVVRPIRPEDAQMEQDFVRHLSDDSRYFRFMVQLNQLSPKKLRYFTEIDYERHLAFVAVITRDGRDAEIGVARYVSAPGSDRCEFAIAVDDAWQGTGVAGILMFTLMDAAREHGFKTMEGFVLTGNHKMLKFARQLGFELHADLDEPGTVHLVREL